jgi:prepilin-type processing-associated H-X9-DG protein
MGDLDGDPNNNSGGTGFGWAYFILPFIEQQGRFEEFDGKKWVADPVNLPVMRKPLNVFNCPSDVKPPFANDGAVTNSATSSYAGCGSSYNGWDGHAPTANPPAAARWNGLFERNNRPPLQLHDILDGTTNTFAIAEARFRMAVNAQGAYTNRKRIYGASDNPGPGTVGASNALLVNGEWQMNWSAVPPETNPQPNRTVASEHPGGAQFALVDGSVRFVRETIAHSATAWVNAAGAYKQPNGQPYGIYQRLFSVRDGLAVSDF